MDKLSSSIFANLVNLHVAVAHTISTYLHTGSEVRTDEIVRWALSSGKTVLVPITDKPNKRLIFSELKDPSSELQIGAFGVREPKPTFRRPLPLEQADVILVPGIAWDLRGYRIGYGAGFYDRTINTLRAPTTRIGLSYEFQVVNRIPRTRFDRQVDKIVTESRVIDTSRFVQNASPFREY